MFVNGYRREAVRDSYAIIADEILESLEGTPVGAFITSVTTGGAYRQVAGELRDTHPEMLVGGAVLSDRSFPSLADDNRNLLRDVTLEGAWEMRDRLAREAGLLVGPKGAAAVKLGLQMRDRLDPETAIVALNPDAGQRYLGWEEETFSDFNREQTET
jgi:cysteine synthase A